MNIMENCLYERKDETMGRTKVHHLNEVRGRATIYHSSEVYNETNKEIHNIN